MEEPTSEFPAERKSASADSALKAEIERVRAMTVEERIREALTLKDWLPNLAEKTKADCDDER